MPSKTLRCTQCRDRFSRSTMQKRPVGWFHSDECLLTYVRAVQDRARAKAELKARRLHRDEQKAVRRKHRAEKDGMRTKQEHLRDAQAIFNRWVRKRDEAAGLPCISCQRHHPGQNHCGHYRTTASCPELRFDEAQCNLQCQPCNTHLSGNILEYRKHLLIKIGQAELDRIEGYQEPNPWSIEDAKEIKAKYLRKLREFDV